MNRANNFNKMTRQEIKKFCDVSYIIFCGTSLKPGDIVFELDGIPTSLLLFVCYLILLTLLQETISTLVSLMS